MALPLKSSMALGGRKPDSKVPKVQSATTEHPRPHEPASIPFEDCKSRLSRSVDGLKFSDTSEFQTKLPLTLSSLRGTISHLTPNKSGYFTKTPVRSVQKPLPSVYEKKKTMQEPYSIPKQVHKVSEAHLMTSDKRQIGRSTTSHKDSFSVDLNKRPPKPDSRQISFSKQLLSSPAALSHRSLSFTSQSQSRIKQPTSKTPFRKYLINSRKTITTLKCYPHMLDDRSQSRKYTQSTSALSRENGKIICCIFLLDLSAYLMIPLIVYPLVEPCRVIDCFDFQRELKRSVLLGKDPCDDFYAFVCDGWKAFHSKVASVIYQTRRLVLRRTLRTLLLQSISRNPQSATGKAAAMFRECVRFMLYKKLNLIDDLNKFMDRFGMRWPLNVVKRNRTDTNKLLLQLSLSFGIPTFFHLVIGQNWINESRYMLHFMESRVLKSWLEFVQTLSETNKLDSYIRFIAEVVSNKGWSYREDILKLKEIHRFVIASFSNLPNTREKFTILRFSDIERISNGLIQSKWTNIINTILPPESAQKDDDVILIENPEHLENYINFIKKHGGKKSLSLYIGWYLLWYMAPIASFRLTRMRFTLQDRTGETEDYILSKCYTSVQIVLPYAIASSVLKLIPSQIIQVVANTLKDIRTAMERKILVWTENKNLVNLLSNIMIDLGIPNALNSADKLDAYYSYIPEMTGNFFNMWLRSRNSTMTLYQGLLNKYASFIPHLRDSMLHSSLELENFSFNSYTLDFDKFFPPYLDTKHRTDVIYAGLGHVFASKIWKTFSNKLSFLESNPHIKLPTDNNFTRLLEAFSECYVSNFNVSVKLIPYIVTYRLAYLAYKKEFQQRRFLEEFKRDQVFFVVSCFKWCSNRDNHEMKEMCMGPLRGMKEFIHAFRCHGRNKHRNPTTKCIFWKSGNGD